MHAEILMTNMVKPLHTDQFLVTFFIIKQYKLKVKKKIGRYFLS